MGTTNQRETEVAERRARVSSFLETHPGEHSPAAISKELGLHVTAVGLILSQMVKSGLINKFRLEGREKLYRWGAPENNGLNKGGTAPKRKYTRRVKEPAAHAAAAPPVGTPATLSTSDPFTGRTFVRLEGAEMSFPINASPEVIGATVAATLVALKAKK